MTKKRTGYAAAALTASLTLVGLGAAYGANLTLAGFGSDVAVEEKSVKAAQAAGNAEEKKVTADKKEETKEQQATAPVTEQTSQEANAVATAATEGTSTATAAAEGTSTATAAGEGTSTEAAAAEGTSTEATAIEGTGSAAEGGTTSGEAASAAGAEESAAELTSTEGTAAEAAASAAEGTTDGTASEQPAPAAEEASTGDAPAAEIDRSMVDTTGFAKADDYVNVRASGDTEGEVVGTLRLNDSVYIEDVDENGWYKIRSGNVEGYVAGYLIATGEEAQAVADSTAYTYAEVGAETLNVRADASQDAEVVDMVKQDANLEVVEDLGDWVKVVTDDGIYGYVSTDYVNTETVYATGETIQEQSEREEQEYLAEVARQEAEYAAYLAEQEAAQAAAADSGAGEAYTDPSYTEAGYTDASATETGYTDGTYSEESWTDGSYSEETYTDPSYTEETYTDASSTDTAYTDATYTDGSGSDVDTLYQAYLNAQEAAMHPTSEEDAIAKANAAIDAYNAYIAACGSNETVASVEAPAAETVTTDSYTEETTTDYYTEETAQTDAPQEETSASSSTGSGIGSQIANYACQFVGNPYVYGGASLTGGADCSGFTMAVFANFGIGLPHNAAAQSGCGTPVSLSDLQPGDLLFYDNGGGIGHVAIYIGGGSVVHASNPETGIKISSYNYRNPVAAVRCV